MTDQSLTYQFIEFEKRHNLFNEEIFGVKIWDYIRLSVLDQVVKEKRGIGDRSATFKTAVSSRSKSKVLKFLIKALLFILKSSSWDLSQKDVLVLNHPRRVRNEKGIYECIYTDPLLKDANFSYCVFEEPLWIEAPTYLTSHLFPIETPEIFFLDRIEAKFIFLNVLYKIKNLFSGLDSSTEQLKITRLIQIIEKEFDVNLNKDLLSKQIKMCANYEKLMKESYENLLNKIKPKAILEFFCPIKSRQLFNKVAREKNIKIIELQHGSFGKREPLFYNFAPNNKPSHYPDIFLLFGDYWRNRARHQIEDENLVSIGFPYLESKLVDYKPNFSNRYQILFISQSIIGEKLSILAYELSRLLKNTPYKIIYKLHPYEHRRWKREYPWLKQDNIQIIDSNNNSIHSYFSKSLCQVGVYSTSIYEGIAYNLYSFIYQIYGSEEMEDLYNRYESVSLISTAQEIAEKLPKIDFNKTIQETSEIARELWKPHSIENFNNYMLKVLADEQS